MITVAGEKQNLRPAIYDVPWAIWEANMGEGSFIAQNGDTTVICNPGDDGSFAWQDEDAGASYTGFKFSTTGAITVTSDIRTKTDIKTLDYSDLLDKYKSVNFVQFKHKRPEGFTKERVNKYNDIHYGVIAQEIEELFPDVVVDNKFGSKDDPYKGVEYSKLQIIANVVIQHQQKKIETLESYLATLTKRVEALEVNLVGG
jgi:hypothetical protein